MLIQTLAPEIEASLLRRWEPLQRNQLHYLVTWGTRGRRPVLRERHARALDRAVRTLCTDRGIPLLEICAGNDHVHLLLSLHATRSVASVVRELKGSTAMSLLGAFPELRVWLRSNLLWDERYSVEMVGPPRVEAVRARLRALHHGYEDLAAAG
jgi:REP element-mobilizing transposase RayT